MSGENKDDLYSRMLSSPVAARITPELIAQALQHFPLTPQRDLEWLARAIKPAVYLAAKSDYPESIGNAATRDELQRLSDRAGDLWRDLFEMSHEAEEAISRYIWSPWISGEGNASPDDIQPQIDGFNEAKRQVDWLTSFLRKAARHVGDKKQSPKWRAKDKQDRRMWFAVWLTPAFEKGFGRKAAWNNRHYANGRTPQYWADFFQRMMEVAFDEAVTPNLEGLLAEARKRISKDGVLFAPGLIPD